MNDLIAIFNIYILKATPGSFVKKNCGGRVRGVGEWEQGATGGGDGRAVQVGRRGASLGIFSKEGAREVELNVECEGTKIH